MASSGEDILRYAIRLRCRNEKEAETLQEICKEIKFRVRKTKYKKLFAVSTWLNEKEDYSILKEAVERLNLPRENYDIFVSVVTEYDTRIIGVPKYVEELAKLIDAPYVFSFTVV